MAPENHIFALARAGPRWLGWAAASRQSQSVSARLIREYVLTTAAFFHYDYAAIAI
jgi:hypothetical protein